MKNWSYLVFCCLLVTASGGAYADCDPANMKGAWRVYSHSSSEGIKWRKCTVEIVTDLEVDTFGIVQAGRVCEDSTGDSYETTGGG